MLFDVQAALTEILSDDFATCATPATKQTERPLVSRLSQVSRSQPRELPAADTGSGQGASGAAAPRTWTGRIVSLDEWRALSRWDRFGPEGRLFCGACQAWVMPGGCPHSKGGAP